MFRLRVMAVVMCGLAPVAGCGSAPHPGAPTAPSTAPPSSFAATPKAEAPPPATPPVDAELFKATSDGAIGYFFISPSGKWRCAIRPWNEAGCSAATGSDLPVAGAPMVASHYDQHPVAPNVIVVDDKSAHFASHGDPHFWRYDQPARTLEYGQELSALGFSCNAQTSGISCRNDATGTGFTFSTEGYRFEYTPVIGAPVNTEPPGGLVPVVLGSGQGGGSQGYGTERPPVITLGNCASAVSKIQWQDWGGPEARGTGLGCVQAGDPPRYTLVASDLGQCHGVPAYRKLDIGGGGPSSICDG